MNILQKTLHSKTIQQPTSTLFPYTTLFRSRKRSKRFSPPKTSGHPIQPPMTENPARIMSGRTIGRGDSWMCFTRSEEHTSELQHTVISYAVFCLKKKKAGPGKRA